MQLFAKTYYCPDLTSQEDAVVIEESLQNAPGIESIEVDHVLHTVLVTTANQSGMADIESRLVDAGFPPEDREQAAGEVGDGTTDPQAYAG